eukprot:3221214-Prymnesium_polylepis.1
MIAARWVAKMSFGRGFLSASAMFLAVGMYLGVTILRSTSSRVKRSRLSMCFDLAKCLGSLETSIAESLSMKSVVGKSCSWPAKAMMRRRKTASHAAREPAA